jgi:hypothetical protein|tara:strand:- start:4197 stop:4643 length:447 start_codon:yes stop_codon:yes gene_type:complete
MEMKFMGIRFRLEIVIACIIIGIVAGCHLFCSCAHTENVKKVAKKVVREGMESMGANLGYDMGKGVSGSWGSSRKVNGDSQQLNTHTGPKLPLAPGQLFFFADTEFKPECCVPPYSGTSSSDGCACVTEDQVNYINMRGGNNTGPSSV